jgi:hypothetical protein
LRGGSTYYLNTTVNLTGVHNGTTIESAGGGEQAAVSGGVVITPTWSVAGTTAGGGTLLKTPVPTALLEALELFDPVAGVRYVVRRCWCCW